MSFLFQNLSFNRILNGKTVALISHGDCIGSFVDMIESWLFGDSCTALSKDLHIYPFLLWAFYSIFYSVPLIGLPLGQTLGKGCGWWVGQHAWLSWDSTMALWLSMSPCAWWPDVEWLPPRQITGVSGLVSLSSACLVSSFFYAVVISVWQLWRPDIWPGLTRLAPPVSLVQPSHFFQACQGSVVWR